MVDREAFDVTTWAEKLQYFAMFIIVLGSTSRGLFESTWVVHSRVGPLRPLVFIFTWIHQRGSFLWRHKWNRRQLSEVGWSYRLLTSIWRSFEPSCSLSLMSANLQTMLGKLAGVFPKRMGSIVKKNQTTRARRVEAQKPRMPSTSMEEPCIHCISLYTNM